MQQRRQNLHKPKQKSELFRELEEHRLYRERWERRAKEIIFTGKPFSAKKACDWGLVNEVRPPDELLIAVFHVAKNIAENAPIAVRQAKQSVHRGLQLSIRDGMAFEIEAYNRTVLSNDRVEGVNAFNQKKKTYFQRGLSIHLPL